MVLWIKLIAGTIAAGSALSPVLFVANHNSTAPLPARSDDNMSSTYFANSRSGWFDLINKGCQPLHGKEVSDNKHDALFVCKGEGGVASFYYYSVEDGNSAFESTFKSSVEKVKNVTQIGKETEEGVYNEQPYLKLVLENDKEETMPLLGSGRWTLFNNVSPEKQCRVVTPIAGSDRVECHLNLSGDQTVFYSFEI